MLLQLEVGVEVPRRDILRKLVEIQYERNEVKTSIAARLGLAATSSTMFPAYEDDSGRTHRALWRRD